MKLLPLLTGVALLATACAQQSKDASMADSGQIDCTTAEADLRVLKSEQDHAREQLETGNSSMIPSGMVTEPEFDTSDLVGTNQYNDYLGDRIARIQAACGL